MKLGVLLNGIEYKTQLDVDKIDIGNITYDSSRVDSNSLFACIKGVKTDGHNYAKDALKRGALVLLCENDLDIENSLIVKNSRKAFSKIAANFLGNPARKLKFIGITGTNGKTTVTKLVKTVLDKTGHRAGLIGTIQNEIMDKVIVTSKTTPDPLEFQRILKDMVDAKCEYVVMEVSSHALDQYRIADTQFIVSGFTNLTQDHLDYHKTMEDYFEAKKKLFKVSEKAVVCADDSYGARLKDEVDCEIITFSLKNNNVDYVIKDIVSSVDGVKFSIVGDGLNDNVVYETPGMFSVCNASMAFLILKLIGLENKIIKEGLKEAGHVKGRSELIKTGKDFSIICDYAHSPDGLINILSSINGYKKGRVVTLFGCGGDRDKTKRPLMGKAAAENSDFLIVTSDNPRTENEDKIIDDIMPAVELTGKPYARITNRKEAIRYAIKTAQKDDIILLAGKGHEDYQVIGEEKINFDEREIVKEILSEEV